MENIIILKHRRTSSHWACLLSICVVSLSAIITACASTGAGAGTGSSQSPLSDDQEMLQSEPPEQQEQKHDCGAWRLWKRGTSPGQDPDTLRRQFTRTATFPDAQTRLLQATFHHSTWVKAQLEEWTRHSGATSEEVASRQRELEQIYLRGDTAFEIWLQTTDLEATNLENWDITLSNPQNTTSYSPIQVTSSLLETTVQTEMVNNTPVTIRLFHVLGQVRFKAETQHADTTIKLNLIPPTSSTAATGDNKSVRFSWKIPK